MTTAPARLGDEVRQAGHPPGPRELLLMIAAIMAMTAIAIDLMLPAFDDIRASYGMAEDSTEVSRIITVFFLGLAGGQLVYGPLADRFGRRPILAVALVVYGLGAIGSAVAPSLAMLLVSRFVWGIGAAGSRVVAVAIIRDCYDGAAMARALSRIMAVFILVPVLAPTIGTGIIAVAPWRSLFWLCVLFAGAVWLWTMRLPETLRPEHRTELSAATVLGGFGRVFRTRITASYTVATMFLQGAFVSWLASSELIIDDIFGRGEQFPFVFGGVALVLGASALLNGRLVSVLGTEGAIALYLVLDVALTSALLVVTLATGGTPSFWIFIPMLAAVLGLHMGLLPNLNALAMGPMGDIAGAASSITGAARIAAGAILGAVVDSQMQGTVTPLAIGLVAGGVAAAAVFAFAQRPSGPLEPGDPVRA